MPIQTFIWAASGTGLSEHAWSTAQAHGAAWVGNDASAHLSLLRSTVEEELAMGMEQRGVDPSTMHTRINQALSLWGLHDHATQDPATLSTGQTRRLAIAAALLTRPHSLVLDCPTDGLDEEAIATLRATLRDFPGEVTVYDRVATPLCEDATAIRALTSAGTLEHVNLHTIQPPWTPARLPHNQQGSQQVAQQGHGHTASHLEPHESPIALQAQQLHIRRAQNIGPITLRALRGSITHLHGPNGSGKTSIFLAIMGLIPYSGQISIPTTAALPKAGFAPTPLDASITQRTVLAEVSLGVGEAAGREALEYVGLQEYASQHPLDIPASARRKTIIAAALARKPQVLLLDEPSVGLDTQGLRWLALLMRSYANGEYTTHTPAVMWTCHDPAFAQAASDHQHVLSTPNSRTAP